MDDDERVTAIRANLRDNISGASRSRLSEVLSSVEALSKSERLLLYLELSDSKGAQPDPLRQPINPLGSRSEIQLTITWIKAHLEEDPQVSLPKHEVYDEYMDYCNDNSLKALSTADFGKVMKQVYPQVRPRRLGTRGNSRYCYAGLKKKVKLEEPSATDCAGQSGDIPHSKVSQSASSSPSNLVSNSLSALKLEEAANFLVLEWVDKLFGQKIHNIKDLAIYLIEKMFVDNSSAAAQAIMATRERNGYGSTTNGRKEISNDVAEFLKRKNATNHSSQVEFQDQTRIKEEHELTLIKRKKIEEQMYNEDNITGGATTFVSPGDSSNSFNWSSGAAAPPEAAPAVPTAGVPHTTVVNPEPGGAATQMNFGTPMETLDTTPSQATKEPVAGAAGVVMPVGMTECSSNGATGAAGVVVGTVGVAQGGVTESDGVVKDDKVEEEMKHYFTETDPAMDVSNNGANSIGEDPETKCDKLSQLRQLLEKNLKSSPNTPNSAFRPAEPVVTSTPDQAVGVGVGGWPEQNSNNVGNSTLCSRRRVSFNPLVVQDTGTSNVLPSPGTRKRHFSFQPISPRQTSLPQSPNASPFISPRSTPVHMLRSRHSSGSALPLHLLPQSSGNGTVNKIGYNSSSSDISRAATFGSTSECSTPFISPHGTPIPFNRSRHNSAQGRLCRSRHSSGLGPYRYNSASTFSPMALNNLNNPYSPQPSTPLAQAGEDIMIGGAPMNVFTCQDNSQRSRHSSAESEPALMMSSVDGLGNTGLVTHVQVQDPSLSGLGDPPPPNTHHSMTLITTRQRHASAGPIPTTATSWGEAPSEDASNAGSSDPMMQSAKPDDLDLALDDLRGLDNDFSKFVDGVNSEKK